MIDLKAYYNKNKELLWNYFWQAVQVAGKLGASFFIFIVVTTLLSKENVGRYNYIWSVFSLLVLFVDFGISTAASKYITEYKAKNNKSVNKIVFNSILLMLFTYIAVILFSLLTGKLWFNADYLLLLYILPIALLYPLVLLYEGIYRGLKQFQSLSIISIIGGGISIGVSVLIINKYGLSGALYSQGILYSILLLFMALKYGKLQVSLDWDLIKKIGLYALTFGLASLGYFLFSRMNVLILGQYGFFQELAHYELLNRIFMIFLLPFTIIAQVMAPYITEKFVLGKKKEVREIYLKVVKYMFGISFLFILVSVLASYIAIHYFIPQYDTLLTWQLLFPVSIIYAQMAFSAPITAGMIVPTGYAKIMVWINVVMGIITVGLIIVMINIFGFIGGVYAILITQTIALLILNSNYANKLKKESNEE